MQGVRSIRRRIITTLIVVLSIVVLVLTDQLFKMLFVKIDNEQNIVLNPIKVIDNFFYLTLVYNTGSAYSFLSDVAWAQTFFKILTPIALCAFGFMTYLSVKNRYKVATIGLILVISGTLGNFIDRLISGQVVDFLTIIIGGKRIFGVFNIADVFLTVGIIMVIVHLLFLDKNCLFGRKNGGKDNKDNGDQGKLE